MATITVCKGCGSRMHATDPETGKEVCVVCIGISPDSGVLVERPAPIELTCECGKRTPFAPTLAFINIEQGTYYCGCRGWN